MSLGLGASHVSSASRRNSSPSKLISFSMYPCAHNTLTIVGYGFVRGTIKQSSKEASEQEVDRPFTYFALHFLATSHVVDKLALECVDCGIELKRKKYIIVIL